MSRNDVQTRNFWSDVRVMRSNLPSRSRTHWENEMPSSNGGFGNNNQTTNAVIPSRARDPTHEEWITRANLCDRSPFERSLSPSRTGLLFGMTRVFILFTRNLFSHRDFSPDAESFYVALVHRFGEHRPNDKLTPVGRFNLVIDLEHTAGRGPEKHRAILPDIDIIDSVD